MSATISFKKNKLKDKTVEIKRIGALPGVVKYVLKKDIPSVEEKSVMVYTTDTTELFIGGGAGQPLKRVSDIITVADVNALPEVGVKEKLYVSEADKVIYFWNGTDGFQQVGGGTGGGGSVIQTKIMEYPTAAEFPAEGQAKAIYIDKETDFLYRYDADTTKYIQLARQAADPTITAKFNAIDKALADKASKTDLSGYRARTDKLTEADLDPATIAKLNTNLAPYDDSALKSRISGVETSKADKVALDDYRKKTDAIAEADLDAGLKGKIDAIPAPYDDSAVKSSISALDAGKADKSALLDYRKNSMKITEADLDSAAQTKLNAPGYDDTDIKADVAALQADAATKTELAAATADVLKKTDKIAETSLTPELVTKINAAATGYDDSAVKADIEALKTNAATKTEVADAVADIADLQTKAATKDEVTAATADMLKKTDQIGETNLAPEVVSKLNAAATGYDDTALKGRVSAVEANKAEMTYTEATYLKKTDKISQEQLPTELTDKVSAIETDLGNKASKAEVTAVADNVTALTTEVNNKASKSDVTAVQTELGNVKTDLTAAKTDLATTKTDLATAKADIDAVETAVAGKADKSDLNNYRPVGEKITAADLDPTVTTEIQKVPTLETTVADLLARVAALETASPVSLTVKSIAAIAAKSVAYATAFGDLGLPTTVSITLSDNTTASASVAWESGSYSPSTAGIQTVTGVITPPTNVTNPSNLKATVSVTVAASTTAPFEYTFQFENPTDAVTGMKLGDINPDLRFTTDEFYITNDIKVYYLGTAPTLQYKDSPIYVPTSIQASEGMAVTSPDGYVDFDESDDPIWKGGRIYFSSGSMGTRVYKVVRV